MESNANEESIEDFSNLTYRQKSALTEYGYLLSPEDAEVVGKMLANFQDKDVLTFCQAHGNKVKTVAPIQNPSLARHSRNLGIVAMAMMISITIFYFTWQVQWYDPDWIFAVVNLVHLTALVLSIIGFVMGINALREKIDRLTAILGLALNSVAFLPLCFFAAVLLFGSQ
jgi:hypothetical protein